MGNYTKCVLTIILIIAASENNSKCQLNVDAGPDQVVCVNLYDMDTITLGGNPTASGGTGNYTYCWETLSHIPFSQYYWYASDFLDDTTIANPTVIEDPIEFDLNFTVTVRDEESNIGVDSCRVIFSVKEYTTIEYNFYVPRGDSTYLYYGNLINSTLPLDSIAWIPQTGVSSPHEPYTWVHPDTSTSYAVYIRDTAGCFGTSAPGYNVFIIPVEIIELRNNQCMVRFIPGTREIFVENYGHTSNDCLITLYSMEGQVMLVDYIRNAPFILSGRSDIIIFYAITDENKIIDAGKLLIE